MCGYSGTVTGANVTVGGKTLSPAQFHYYKQQQLAKQQQQQQQQQRLQQQLKVIQAHTAAGQSNQKVSVAVTTGTPMGIATVAGVTAVQVSPAQQQRAQVFFKQIYLILLKNMNLKKCKNLTIKQGTEI